VTVGDLADVASAIAPRALSLVAPVDGQNRLVGRDRLRAAFETARHAYETAGAADRLQLTDRAGTETESAAWLSMQLRRDAP
jgi:hypothetical protein